MKKNYHLLWVFVAVFLMHTLKMGAQLSGVVTINNLAPASVTNFTSFTAFATAINGQGVSGPLTVNVSNGPYTEQVIFTQATGISVTNTVTVNGNGCTLTFANGTTGAPHTLGLNGADYMFFHNLKISGTHTQYALAVHLWGGANNNQFIKCSMTTQLLGTNSTQVPYSISGSGTSATSAGNSGNENIVNTCTISGGYYNTVFYGASAAPFNFGNKVLNSYCVDFYLYGIYNVYCIASTAKGNIVERLNRTNPSTCYAIYFSTGSNSDEVIEGNHIRNVFGGTTGNTNVAYGIYVIVAALPGKETIIRNNIVSDIKTTGTIYGISAYYANIIIDHNTVVLDEVASTGGAAYGIYASGSGTKIRNNISYVSKGGTGNKYCLYTNVVSGQVINNNVYTMLSTTGSNGLVYITTPATTFTNLPSWRAYSGYDLLSVEADPLFNAPSFMDYAPTSTTVNNLGMPLGVPADIYNGTRNQVFPDPGAIEVYTTICAGVPGANSFTAPAIEICPNSTLSFNLANTGNYMNSGYTISWQAGTTSLFGPFTAVPGATLNNYQTPGIPVDSYYRAVITCINGGQSYTTAARHVTVTASTSSTVPYYESFEKLGYNKLPNCSWSASNVPPNTWTGGTTLTYTTPGTGYRSPRTGSNFASFYNNPGGTNYFYTNGIFLNAGITYSASLYFIHETAGFNNWSDLSILVGPNQGPANMKTIVSTNGTLTPNLYTQLSDTFEVGTSGMYYIAVRAMAGNGTGAYLSWDDLEITIPCQFNSPKMIVLPGAQTICKGQATNITAYGAGGYTWLNTSQTTSVVTVAPSFPTTYTVIGDNLLSGCSTTMTQFIDVIESPVIGVSTDNPSGCPGQSFKLTATGASAYYWAHGANTNTTTVNPSTTTTYSVSGTNAFGCGSMATIELTVTPAPVVSIANIPTVVCQGDVLTLTGAGAINYKWMVAPNNMLTGNPVTHSPNASATYTMIGADSKGCEGKATITLMVNECTGLSKLTTASGVISVYPNPNNGVFVVELNGSNARSIEVMDISGRVVFTQNDVRPATEFNISDLAGGIYYIRVNGETTSEVIKVVKTNN